MARTAAQRAQQVLDGIDARITKLTERKQKAVKKVEDRFADELRDLQIDREHAANAPALRPRRPSAEGFADPSAEGFSDE